MPVFLLGEFWGGDPGKNPFYPTQAIVAESIEQVANYLKGEAGTYNKEDVIWISKERILEVWDGQRYPYGGGYAGRSGRPSRFNTKT